MSTSFEINMEKMFTKIDPTTLRYLKQMVATPQRRRIEKEQKAKTIYSPFIAEIKPNVDIEVGIETKGRRYILWRFNVGLDKHLTPKIMEKIRENSHTAFFIRYVYGSLLQIFDDPKNFMVYCSRRKARLGSMTCKND